MDCKFSEYFTGEMAKHYVVFGGSLTLTTASLKWTMKARGKKLVWRSVWCVVVEVSLDYGATNFSQACIMWGLDVALHAQAQE